MRKAVRMMLCLLLATCLLLQTVAAAENMEGETMPTLTEETVSVTEPEETVPAEPDPLEGYTFPDNWAGEPLKFAVRNGILQGRKNKNLDPTGNTTRAEMAAMLVRLLSAHGSVSLEAYQDVKPNGWYYGELSAAVELGIFNGVSGSTMAPNRHITRQETLTVLARAFGLEPQNPDAYQTFTDAGKVDAYARGAVSALAELGVASGYPDGSLRPRNPITRQEVAALFYKLLDAICDDPQALPTEGFVLYRGSQPLVDGTTFTGTLILAAGLSGDVTLRDLTVGGNLILRCSTGTNLTFENLNAETLSQVSSMTTGGTGVVDTLRFSGSGGATNLSAGSLTVSASGTFGGSYETLTLTGGSAVVEGTVGTALVTGNNTSLTGSGYAETVILRGRHCDVTLACGQTVDEVDWGLEGVQAVITGTDSVSDSSPKLSLTAVFTGFQAGYGTDGTGRLCRLEWYEGSRLVSSQDDFWLCEGATASYETTYSKDYYIHDTTFRVVLICGQESVSAEKQVKSDVYGWDYANALKIVETVRIEARTNRDTYLYTDKSCSTVLRSLPKGTDMIHLYYSGADGAPGKVELKDGTVGWVNWQHYDVSRKAYTTTDDYSLGVKEGFVNLKGYSSSTGYLIWINLKTQQVNIFEGSKGAWKMIRTYDCATGTNLTPTVSGVYSIIYKTDTWHFNETVGGVYYEDYYYVKNVSGFWGGQAFHSRLYRCSDDSLYSGVMGVPASHGCVRMMDEGCGFIYDTIPYYTTVVIY